MSILHQFIGTSISDEAAKRRKVCTVTIDGEPLDCQQTNSASLISVVDDELPEASESSVKSDGNVGVASALSLVKLIRSGLILLTFPKDHSHNVVATVADIIQSLESGSLKAPLWCHRIFPIQATCTLNEQELSIIVSKLVTQFVKDEGNKTVRPVKFAVAYNRRGFGETATKCLKATLGDSDAIGLLDRQKCFAVVAGAVKDVISDSVVDLTFPELSIFVEMLPLSRVPNASLIVGVSVLPFNLVTTKPKLCVKTLVSDMKAGSRKMNEKDSTVGK